MGADIPPGTASNGSSTCAAAQGRAELDTFFDRHFRVRA